MHALPVARPKIEPAGVYPVGPPRKEEKRTLEVLRRFGDEADHERGRVAAARCLHASLCSQTGHRQEMRRCSAAHLGRQHILLHSLHHKQSSGQVSFFRFFFFK